MGSKCKIASVIISCFLLILIISGAIIYFIINNSLERHAERCAIRYLYDQGMLSDVRFEESPSAIPFDNCKDVIIKIRQRAREEMKIPCNLHDNKEFIEKLENLGMLNRIYKRIHQEERANDVKREIGMRINNKCNGIRAMMETVQPNYV